jgi:tryptophan halogenase
MFDEAERLQALVRGLGIKYGFERSFRLSPQGLRANRFLLGFRKHRLGGTADQQILNICERLDMPQTLLERYRAELPDAQYVHFGFEQGESSCLFKAYLEFHEKVDAHMRSTPGRSDPQLMHLGFKWAATGGAAPVLTSYVWHPFITVESMFDRVANLLGSSDTSAIMEATRGLVRAAAARVQHRGIFYMEATEQDNPRHSFDINMYRAGLRMEELDLVFDRLSAHFDLAAEECRILREGIRSSILGHVAGGIDRTGGEFMTVYHGIERIKPVRLRPTSMTPAPPIF